MRTFATSLPSWSPGSPRPAASRNARRRPSVPLLEPLEERCLLDGQLSYGDFGGPCRSYLHHTCTLYSAIGMGSALSAALVILNLGGTGPGAGQSYEEHSTEGDSLVPPPADWQQLGPVLSPEQLAPQPVMMTVAPEPPIMSDDIIESVVRAVVTPLP